MQLKLLIYRFVENITPPIVFRLIRKSPLYGGVVRLLRLFEKPTPLKEIAIVKGDLAGFKLKLSGEGDWQKEMIDGDYDQELFSCVRKMSLDGKVVYDIGSHIGYHSLAFATYVGQKGHVYSFEPNPANIKRTQEIVELNRNRELNITPLNLALSNEVGIIEFLSTDNVENGTSTGGFIKTAKTIWPKHVFVEKTGFTASAVPVDTIDNLIQNKKILPPDFMKIDVEGAEQLVLAGAEKTITKHHPIIIVEFHSIYSTYACMELLNNYGYQTKVLKEEADGRIMILAK